MNVVEVVFVGVVESESKEFKEFSCMEMMDVLMCDMVKW